MADFFVVNDNAPYTVKQWFMTEADRRKVREDALLRQWQWQREV